MDVRGHGQTSADWPDLSARAVGSDVVQLVDHLQAGPAVVLGNSFAAGSALWAAQQSPAAVSAIVLLGPIVRDGAPNIVASTAVKLGFAGPWRVWFWMAYWNSLFPSRLPEDHAQAKAALAANLREPGRMDALRAMVGLSKADTEAIVTHSKVPALVVMGSRDPDFKNARAEAEWLAAALSADSLIVDGAGHYPHLERVDLVAPRVLSFLDRVSASRVAAR